MRLFLGRNMVTSQVGAKLVFDEWGIEEIVVGPVMKPGDDVSTWWRGTVECMIASGLLTPSGREEAISAGKKEFSAMGFAWNEEEGS